MKTKLFPILASAIAVGLALPASAQVIGGRKLEHHSIDGDIGYHKQGFVAAGLGDLDGDSVPDYVLGGHSRSGSTGRVTAYSGATGLEIWAVDGEASGDEFGYALVNMRDINDDGVNDLAVSAPMNDGGAADGGKVYVLSGTDGSQLITWVSTIPDRQRGRALGAADIDNDGYKDVVCGMSNADEFGMTDNGKISIFNAKTGAHFPASEVFGSLDDALFGFAVTGVGDWNNDGYEDIAVGAPGIDVNGLVSAGRASVFSGAFLAAVPGSVQLTLHIFDGTQTGGKFGADVARAGDIDGDGETDLIVGEPFWDNAGGINAAGRASIWSSDTKALYASFESPDPSDYGRFGTTVAPGGDVDNDGYRDVLISAPYEDDNSGNSVGAAFVFSGRTLDLLQGNRGSQLGGGFGLGLSPVGDIDGDGTHEYVIGAPFASTGIFTLNGAATVMGREAFLYQDAHTVQAGDTVNYDINFPTAGGQYKILASLISTGPTTYHGTEVPLGPLYIPITSNNYPAFTSGFLGNLDANGEATASMTLPPATPPITVYLAAVQSNSGLTVDMSSVVQILTVQ